MHQPFDTQIVDNYTDVLDLLTYLKGTESPYLSYDVETDGLQEKTAKLFGLGLCTEEHESFYIPFRRPDKSEIFNADQLEVISTKLLDLFKAKKGLAHNAVFDILILKSNLGIDVTSYLYADTMLMKHMIDEEPPHSLKDNAVRFLGSWANKAQQDMIDNVRSKGGSVTKENFEMWKADTDILGVYCAFDVQLTLRLFHHFTPMLKEQNLEKLFYQDEIMPLYREVTIPMKDGGFPIDLEHFKKLKVELEQEIQNIEHTIQTEIRPLVKEFEDNFLDKFIPARKTGDFPKFYSEATNYQLPTTPDGRITLAKKELAKIPTNPLIEWIVDNKDLDPMSVKNTQKAIFFHRNPEERYIFNLNSTQHLSWLFFTKLGITPTEFTDSGAPKLDAEVLENLQGEHQFADKIIEYKKLQKLLGTYVIGILDRQVNGIVYTSMLQAGTTSGRYASRDPNLNNLPALKGGDKVSPLIKKYTNAIRAGFVSPKGFKVVASDFSAIEPHLVAYKSGDPILVDTFVTGKDFYSTIGILQFNKADATPYKDDSPESFAVKYEHLRKLVKTYSLAVLYGSGAHRIAELLHISKEEAQELLDGYFDNFPSIKKFIEDCHTQALTKGYVSTQYGRIRHLGEAKRLYGLFGKRLLNYRWAKDNGLTEQRYILKNLLNNAVNFQIQGLAAHALNRAMLLTTRKLKEYNINARIVLSIHDEILLIAEEGQAERAAEVLKWCMENCIDISPIKLKAQPIIGRSYAECK